MDFTLPRRLADHCPRCKDSLDCAVFVGLTVRQKLVMVCEECYRELQDPGEPACYRSAAIRLDNQQWPKHTFCWTRNTVMNSRRQWDNSGELTVLSRTRFPWGRIAFSDNR
jgi:hypothetical protein